MMAKIHRLHRFSDFETGRDAWESAPFAPGCDVQTAIASWQARTPPDAWIEVQVRAEQDGRWSRWFSFGRWTTDETRGSITDQVDENGRMETDTLRLAQPAQRLQMRASLAGGARLDRLYLLVSGEGDPASIPPTSASPSGAWGKDLPVPAMSQMLFPNGGRVWCSPVSLAMVLAFWGHAHSIPDHLVPLVYDPVYKGHGNWPFNTAVAALDGLDAYVTRLYGLPQLERWIAAGVPVICSVAYQRSWLEGAPIDQTRGHLLVARGFTATGDVIVNDPAGSTDDEVTRVYRRDQFDRAWTGHSGGVVYLIHPPDYPLPPDSGGAW